MSRVYNFSAGPAVLPEEVLQQAAAEMLDWHGSGMSVMEMSHRDKEFMSIAAQAESDLRALMQIPSGYTVLFLHGGASHQFAQSLRFICAAQIQLRRTLAASGIDYQRHDIWQMRGADGEHIGSMLRQRARGNRGGYDTRQIQHTHAA